MDKIQNGNKIEYFLTDEEKAKLDEEKSLKEQIIAQTEAIAALYEQLNGGA